jgi:hypothetical protein
VRDHVKKYATFDNFDQIKPSSTTAMNGTTTGVSGDQKVNGQSSSHQHNHHNNHNHKGGDKHSDKGSELSETSDLDGLDDDEDGEMNLGGSDDEEERKSQ